MAGEQTGLHLPVTHVPLAPTNQSMGPRLLSKPAGWPVLDGHPQPPSRQWAHVSQQMACECCQSQASHGDRGKLTHLSTGCPMPVTA